MSHEHQGAVAPEEHGQGHRHIILSIAEMGLDGALVLVPPEPFARRPAEDPKRCGVSLPLASSPLVRDAVGASGTITVIRDSRLDMAPAYGTSESNRLYESGSEWT